MEDVFSDENGYALLSLLKSLGEEINKVCETERLLTENWSNEADSKNNVDIDRLIRASVDLKIKQDTFHSPEICDTESNSPYNESSHDSIVHQPPPDYSDDGEDYSRENELHMTIDAVADADELEQDASDKEGELLGEDDIKYTGEGDESEDEWVNDDDAGYIQIVISKQEFIELEEEAASRFDSYNRMKNKHNQDALNYDEDGDQCDEEDRESSRQNSEDSLMRAEDLHLSETMIPSLPPRQSLDLTATSPVVEDLEQQSEDEEDPAPPPDEEEAEEGEEEEEEDLLASDLATVERQLGLFGKDAGGRGYNSRLSVDDDDQEEDEEEEGVVDGSDVFVEIPDVVTGKSGRVGGSSTRESDHTTSGNSRVSKMSMGSQLFSGGGAGSHRRNSEIMGQRKINGVDGEHRYFDLKIIFEPYRTGFEEEKNFIPEQGQIIAGRYRVVELLGQAAFSNAWQCIDTNPEDEDSEWVCLKVIKNSKDFFDQSLDEIKLLQYINSKGDPHKYNVLKMIDYFYFKEHLFIVSELLRENLYEFGKYIRESGEPEYFTIPRLKKIMKQVLEALQYIHSLNLIHCDIKPENIVIKSYSRCEVKLIDFGSSCFTTDVLTSYIQSRSYRAPEVVLGLDYGANIDIWSLGGVLAEMHTGYVIFQNDSLATMMARIEGIMGPYPQYMLDEGKETNRFYTSAGVAYDRVENSDGSVSYSLIYPKKTTLRRRLHISSPPGPLGEMTEDDLFVDFVGAMLRVDPAERPSAGQTLLHPWLDDVDSLDVSYVNDA